MTLRRKTLLITGITIIGLIGILFITSRTILMSGFEQLEQDDMLLNTERVISALYDDVAEVSSIVSDWAYWNDTLDFVEGNYPEYIDDNLTEATLANLRINFMLFADRSGEIIHGVMVDIDSEEEISIPIEFLDYIKSNSQLVIHPDEESLIEGTLMTPQGPLIIGARPILTSDEEGPSRGSLIMGRFLDDQAIKLLGDTTQLSLSAYPLDDAQTPDDVHFAVSNLSLEEPILIQSLDPDTIAGYTQVYDVFENPILIFRVDKTRDIFKQGQTSLTYFTLSMVLFGLIFTVISMLLLERGVLSRLSTISETVAKIGSTGNLSERVAVSGKDELSHLSTDINQMLNALENSGSKLEERNRELANQTKKLADLSGQLQAAADLGRAATTILNLDELLHQVTHLINNRFGYYHVGIFLLDASGEYAVLRAANSEGGRAMLASNHQLQVGSTSIVGYVTEQRKPRIALDVGVDAVFLNNPELPNTRSELALPLIVGDQLLGALDIQSTEKAAFDEDSIWVLQVLVDQIAIAINNARLFSQSQDALETAQRSFGEISSEAWRDYLNTQADINYISTPRSEEKIQAVEWSPEMAQTYKTGQITQPSEDTLNIPIILRDQTLGVVRLRKQEGAGTWSNEEIDLMDTLVDQLESALEAARLYSDTQVQAQRVRLTHEITDRLHRSLDIEILMQTFLQDISTALGASNAYVQLSTEIDASDQVSGKPTPTN